MSYGAWVIGLFFTKGDLEIVHQAGLIQEGIGVTKKVRKRSVKMVFSVGGNKNLEVVEEMGYSDFCVVEGILGRE